ncbi:helix-turn-helix domain-containing protein [Pseudomonas sp. zjy_8]
MDQIRLRWTYSRRKWTTLRAGYFARSTAESDTRSPSTDLQIQQVAEQAGFASATVFGRCFKRAFAQTPRAYRQSLPTNRQ